MQLENLEDIYELSPLQQGLLFHTLYAPASGIYFEQFSWKLKGKLDAIAFRKAWQQVIDRHPILRTAFYWQELEKPYQVVYKQVELPWQQEDWRDLSPQERETKLNELLKRDRASGFDVSQAPLMRIYLLQLSDDTYQFIWSSHHLLLDGWSESIVFKEVYAFYQANCQGRELQLERFPTGRGCGSRPYRDYITWLQQQDLAKAEAFWREKLKGFTAPTPLGVDRARGSLPSQEEDCDRSSLKLSAEITEFLQSLARQNQLTLNTLVQGAWALLLSRYSSESDIVFGITSSGRPTNLAEVESMVGLFVNTLPLRVQVDPEAELIPWLQQIQAQNFEMRQYEYSPLVEIQGWSDVPRGMPLFESSQVLENYPVDSAFDREINSLSFEIQSAQSFEKTNDPLSLIAIPDKQLKLEIWYDTRRFELVTVRRMLGHLETLLSGFLANPNVRLQELSLLTAEEHERLLVEFNQNQSKIPSKINCIHQLFEAQVERSPDRIAVIWQEQKLTYRELNQQANQLAHYLSALGVEKEVLVGVCLERSLETVISILAILKAGGAYLPLDPNYPQQRLEYMLQDSQVPPIVTQKSLVAKLVEHQAKVVCLDSDREIIAQHSIHNPKPKIQNRSSLAYVIYTSGSTGKPKGVMVEHQSLVNAYFAWEEAYCLSTLAITHLQMASFSFDVFTGDWVRTLCSGGKLVLCPTEMLLQPEALYHLMQSEKIDSGDFVPAVILNLLTYLEQTGQSLEFMRLLVVGSDRFLWQDYQRLKRFCGERTRLINAYGVTEATIDSCYFEATTADLSDGSLVPIGRPFVNTQIYLLDRDLQPVPIGVPGELHIGGKGVTRGYLNRRELTDEKFIPNRFGQGKLYKTGDLARYLEDGNIEFLGRIDDQVKIRGFRIELGEIEATINSYPAIRESAVLMRENRSLVAYLVPSSQDRTETEGALETEQLNQWQIVHNDEVFNETQLEWEASFNISGWNSSYNEQPIPAKEMREWVDATVDRILALNPQRVLEIGCGTGLLLFRIAPHTSQYWGTDFSSTALDYVTKVLQMPEYQLPQVKLWQKLADDFDWIESDFRRDRFADRQFDTIILNSVIQYFPNIDYLLRVIEGAVKVLAPGGQIFIGDVRNLSLLEAFHTSVLLFQSPDSLSTAELRSQLQKRLASEQELAIDPAFFVALTQKYPQISHVQIQLKRGQYCNELNKFRYDVILRRQEAEEGRRQKAEGRRQEGFKENVLESSQWLNWKEQGLTLDRLRQLLESSQPDRLNLQNVPNARLSEEIATQELLATEAVPQTVGELRSALGAITERDFVDPEDLWQLAEELDYAIAWSSANSDGSFKVILQQSTTTIPLPVPLSSSHRPWNTYANNPLQGKMGRYLVPQLREYLQAKLPDYMVPSAFVVLNALPLTPNGKLDRKALPAPDAIAFGAAPSAIASQTPSQKLTAKTPTQEMLANIWAQILGVENVGIEDNFFELGGHSLLATQVVSRVREVFGVELPLRYLFEFPTVAGLARCLEEEIQTQQGLEVPSIQPVNRQGELPLSFAQQRLWLHDRLISDRSLYNDPIAVRLQGTLNVWALRESINEIVRRHEVLRTALVTIQGQPKQVLSSDVNIDLPIVDLRHLPPTEREAQALRLAVEEADKPFDLSQAPLLRTTLLWLDEKEYIALMTLHHIVSDGWSIGILLQEMTALYEAFSQGKPSPLSELPIQYSDFAVWQRQWLQGEVLEKQLCYWRQQLGETPPRLMLPTDKPRPAVPSYKGKVEHFLLPLNLTKKLMQLSQQEGVTLFMTLLAAFKALLHCYSNSIDIIVGSPIANRNRTQIESLIGFFVNTLVLRTNLENNPSFRELLERVREVTLGAYAHQDLPFEKIVETIQSDRTQHHLPLFQVWFVLQNTPLGTLELPGLTLTPLEIDNNTTQYDLGLFLVETPEGLSSCFEYSTDLFAEATIRRLIQHLQIILDRIVTDPDIALKTLADNFLLLEKQQQDLKAKQLETNQLHMLKNIKRKSVLSSSEVQ
jgi:amino acid adenylation domain-containing protein